MKDTYINIDKHFQRMTKLQLAFLVFIHKMNSAGLVFTNKEACSSIGIEYHKATIPNIINRINFIYPGLIEIRHNAFRNSQWKLKTLKYDKDTGEVKNNQFHKCRSVRLNRPLHIKGEEYINIPSNTFEVTKLSGNELFILKFLKSIGNKFRGFQRVIANKLSLTLNKVRYALNGLKRANLITMSRKTIHQKLKNSYYSFSMISFNGFCDRPKSVQKSETYNTVEEDREWDAILSQLNGF